MFYKRIWRNVEQGKVKQLKKYIRISNGLRKVGIDARPLFFESIQKNFGGRLCQIASGGKYARRSAVFDDIGMPIVNAYGITECSPGVAVNPLTALPTIRSVIPFPASKSESIIRIIRQRRNMRERR